MNVPSSCPFLARQQNSAARRGVLTLTRAVWEPNVLNSWQKHTILILCPEYVPLVCFGLSWGGLSNMGATWSPWAGYSCLTRSQCLIGPLLVFRMLSFVAIVDFYPEMNPCGSRLTHLRQVEAIILCLRVIRHKNSLAPGLLLMEENSWKANPGEEFLEENS